MSKIKYLSKVWLPDNAIFVDHTFRNDGETIVATSLDKMFEQIKEEYHFGNGKRNTLSKYIKIGIYNLNTDNVAPKEADMTYRSSKDILCKYAYYRALYLSPNLTEVYCEFFHLDVDKVRGTGFECRYDYGILYGNYPSIKLGSTVRSNYIPKKDLVIDRWKHFSAGIDNLDDKCPLGFDIGIFYIALWDEYFDDYYNAIDYDSEYPDKFEDGCVPVSTMKIVKEGRAELQETKTE